jgi:hypothetical protein
VTRKVNHLADIVSMPGLDTRSVDLRGGGGYDQLMVVMAAVWHLRPSHVTQDRRTIQPGYCRAERVRDRRRQAPEQARAHNDGRLYHRDAPMEIER